MNQENDNQKLNELKEKMRQAKKNQEEKEGCLQYLLGRKVKMTFTEHTYGKGKDKMKYKEYEIVDPEFVAEINNISSDNRIFPPGTMGTMDYKMSRLNVYINAEGVVTKVNYG